MKEETTREAVEMVADDVPPLRAEEETPVAVVAVERRWPEERTDEVAVGGGVRDMDALAPVGSETAEREDVELKRFMMLGGHRGGWKTPCLSGRYLSCDETGGLLRRRQGTVRQRDSRNI